MTLAEALKQKYRNRFGKPVELSEFAGQNLLGLKVGGLLTIDDMTCRDLYFQVAGIGVATETIDQEVFPFTDYILVATPAIDDPRADDSGRVRRRLLVFPVEETDRFLQFHLVLLDQFAECNFQQAAEYGLYDRDHTEAPGVPFPVLQDPKGEFHDNDTGDVYYRRFGRVEPHRIKYTLMRDADGNGRVDDDEIQRGLDQQYWDYEKVDNVGGRTLTRLLYIFEDDTGIMRLYKGKQLLQDDVVAL